MGGDAVIGNPSPRNTILGWLMSTVNTLRDKGDKGEEDEIASDRDPESGWAKKHRDARLGTRGPGLRCVFFVRFGV